VTAPAYGYAHRGRVLRAGSAEGHYVVHIPALAPGCASGPFQSTIRDLEPGDNVLLTQVGLTVGDLVITGRLPERPPDFTLPINISDVAGLQTALDNRATDAELAAVDSTLTASILTEHNTNVTQDGRLTSLETRATTIEGVNTTQDGRLTTAEGTIASHTTTLTSNTSTLATHTSELTALETWSRFSQSHDFDVYGDILSTFPRILTSNIRQLVNQALFIWRSRVRVAATLTTIRVICTTVGAGVGGSCTGALFRSSSTSNGPYTLVGSGTNTLTATGRQNFTFTGVPVVAGDYLLVAFLSNNSYTTAPRIAALQNAAQVAAALQNSTNTVWGTKLSVASMPSSITSDDGSWTADNAPWWLALA
jgi:hypothetical protein